MPPEVTARIKVEERMFDLSDNRDLTELENICSRPDKYKLVVDETVMLPFRHVRYEQVIK